VTLSGIAVAGTLRLAALHHSFRDGPLEEIIQLAEFFPGLEEGLGGGAKKGLAGCFARGHDSYRVYRISGTPSYCRITVVLLER
jgi:hypothetical protein